MTTLISLHEAAQRLGVHISTLRSWVHSGRIPSYRVGQRFARVDWDQVLAELATAGRDDADESVRTKDGPA